MKLYSRLCLLGILIFVFSACNKDEGSPTDGNIVGTWRLTDVHSDNGVSETTIAGQTYTSTYNFHGKDYAISTTFTENPNEYTSTGSYTVITNVTLAGQTTSDTTSVDASAGAGKWSINGNMLTQIYAGDTSTFEVLELSNSKLRLKDELDETVADTTFGLTIHDKATVFTSFEKQ